jgi:hypothetical protein
VVAGFRIGPPSSSWALMNLAMSSAVALIAPSGVSGSKMNGTRRGGVESEL